MLGNYDSVIYVQYKAEYAFQSHILYSNEYGIEFKFEISDVPEAIECLELLNRYQNPGDYVQNWVWIIGAFKQKE